MPNDHDNGSTPRWFKWFLVSMGVLGTIMLSCALSRDAGNDFCQPCKWRATYDSFTQEALTCEPDQL